MIGQRNQGDQSGKVSFLTIERGSAVCSVFKQLSFACRRSAEFQIDRIKGRSGALLVLFRFWRQSAFPSGPQMCYVQVSDGERLV